MKIPCKDVNVDEWMLKRMAFEREMALSKEENGDELRKA